jgi:hypothetical protein
MRQPTDLAVGGSARGTASDSPRPATRPDHELPFTGSAAPVLLAVGPALVANGILLVRFGTRRLQPCGPLDLALLREALDAEVPGVPWLANSGVASRRGRSASAADLGWVAPSRRARSAST